VAVKKIGGALDRMRDTSGLQGVREPEHQSPSGTPEQRFRLSARRAKTFNHRETRGPVLLAGRQMLLEVCDPALGQYLGFVQPPELGCLLVDDLETCGPVRLAASELRRQVLDVRPQRQQRCRAAFSVVALVGQIEQRQHHPAAGRPAQGFCDCLTVRRIERSATGNEKHVVVAEHRRFVLDVRGAESRQQQGDALVAEQEQVLVRLELFQESIAAPDHVGVRRARRVSRRLDDEHTIGLQQREGVAHRADRIRQVLEYVHEGNRVERPRLERLLFQHSLVHGDVEGVARERDHPRAQLETRGIEPGPLQERDEPAVSAAELEDAPRRPFVFQERAQPVGAPLRQIGACPRQDAGLPEVAFLMGEPIVLAVEIGRVVLDERQVLREREPGDERVTRAADRIRVGEWPQVGGAAPARVVTHGGGRVTLARRLKSVDAHGIPLLQRCLNRLPYRECPRALAGIRQRSPAA
jgi:hypothetical protein